MHAPAFPKNDSPPGGWLSDLYSLTKEEAHHWQLAAKTCAGLPPPPTRCVVGLYHHLDNVARRVRFPRGPWVQAAAASWLGDAVMDGRDVEGHGGRYCTGIPTGSALGIKQCSRGVSADPYHQTHQEKILMRFLVEKISKQVMPSSSRFHGEDATPFTLLFLKIPEL